MNDGRVPRWNWNLFKKLSQLDTSLWLPFSLASWAILVGLWFSYQTQVGSGYQTTFDSKWFVIGFASLNFHQISLIQILIITNGMLIIIFMALVAIDYCGIRSRNLMNPLPVTVFQGGFIDAKNDSSYACAISKAEPMADSTHPLKSNSIHSKNSKQESTGSSKKNNNLPQRFHPNPQKTFPLLDNVAEEIALALSAKVSCIYALNQKLQELIPVSFWCVSDNSTYLANQSVNGSVIGFAAQSTNQDIVRVDDLEHDDRFDLADQDLPYKAILALPLTVLGHKQPVGVLMVADKLDSSPFSVEDEQQLLALANQNSLSLTVQNTLLQTEKELWVKELNIINKVSQAFIDSAILMDVKAACRAVLAQPYLKELFNFDIAEICLWDEETQIATTTMRSPESVEYDRIYRPDEGYTGWIIENQSSLCIGDTHRRSDIRPKMADFPYRSYMGAPLKISARLVGTLELAAYPVNAYDQKDVTMLEIVANHAAVALANAQTYQQQLLEREQASRRFELEKQRRQLADTLRNVAEAISSSLEFDDLLNIVLQGLAEIVDYDSANVQLLEGDQLVIIGGRGWQEDSQKVIGLTFPMIGDNPNRLVIEIQEPVIVVDVQREYPDSFSGIHKYIRSWLGVPLTYGTNILGLMALDKDEPNYYSQDDADFVLAFANQVAIALQNARLFDAAREQVRQLAALTEVAQSINRALELNVVLNLVLDAVFDLVGDTTGSIWLIDSNTDTVKIADTRNIPDFLVDYFNESNTPIDAEPFASVIRSGEVLIIEGSTEKSDEIASYKELPFPDDVTYVPLKTEDGVIGILAIELVIHNKNMLELVTTLADLAAVAIDSARLLGDTRRRATEMQHLYNLGVEVSGMLEVQQVMRSVVNNALTLTDTQIGAILFWDEEIDQYIIEGTTTTEELAEKFDLNQVPWQKESSKQNPVSLWSDLTRQIIDTRQPIMASLATRGHQPVLNKTKERVAIQDDIGQAKHIAMDFGIQGILGVPIQVQNQMSGAIFVSTLTPFNFTNWDLQSLSFVANQASVAVRNAQLVQRLNMLTEELEQRVTQRTKELARTLQDLTEERDRVETLYQITRELSTSFDLDRVLNEALHLINRAIGVSHGVILLLDTETENLIYRAALGRDKPLPRGGFQTKYRLGYGLAGKVMETRQPRLVPDLTLDKDWIPSQEDDERHSAIAVPLSTGDEVQGALMLFHFEPDYFTEDHMKLVSAAGAQIATAINNAELYRLIREQAERLGVMYRTQASEAAKNQAILEGITDGVLVLDANRNIVLINPKAAEILNINASILENQPLRQILEQSESPVELELAQLLYDGLSESLIEIETGKSSAQFRIETGHKAVMVTLAPVALSAEEPQSIVAVVRDISKEVEIDRIKNEFISTVSHELRTPMTSIKGYADLLLSGKTQVGDLNPTQHRFVKVIQSNADRLTELVNDILEISRIETGRIKLRFETLDIIKIIKDVALSFEGQMVKKAMNLSLNLPDHLPAVYADKARLTQVLVNLIGNAWQYTPEGGNINVYAALVDKFIRIDVEDNGIGIVEKDVEYVFDRFFRSERTAVQVVDGTGLGLSITRSFVELLGGQIWVKSEIDVGSTFSFTVPLDTGKHNGDGLTDE